MCLVCGNEGYVFKCDVVDGCVFFVVVVGFGGDVGELFEDVVIFYDLVEGGVLVIEEMGFVVVDEKLVVGGVGIGGVGYGDDVMDVGFGVEFGFDLVVGVVGVGYVGLVFFGVGVVVLDYEVFDDVVKGGVVIKFFVGEFFEVFDGFWCDVGLEGDGDFVVGGFEDGVFVGGRCGFVYGKLSKVVGVECG